jgi:prepilin-type N-terminal cleavage/methylation domain-containing protein
MQYSREEVTPGAYANRQSNLIYLGVNKMKQTFKRNIQKGFTLVELLIVVIILAILAAIVVPQFSSSTTDANNSAVQSNLATVRSAIELYSAQHSGKYPGAIQNSDGTTTSTAANAGVALTAQLTQFSNDKGKTYATAAAATADGATKVFGPYLRGSVLPADPTNSNKTDITAQITGAALVTAGGALVTAATTAYSYDATSGQIVSNTNPKF